MKIVYLDTTTSNLYVAILENDHVLINSNQLLKNEMSIKTLPTIKRLLKEVNMGIKDIDKIIVVNGPGSFTGTRIGLTIAKTLAWATKTPIITISSIEAMALSYLGNKNFIVPVIDARRGYVYGAIYDINNKSFILNEQYISFNALKISTETFESDIDFISNDELNIEFVNYIPNYSNIVKNVMDREAINPHLVDANYLKLTEAEENL